MAASFAKSMIASSARLLQLSTRSNSVCKIGQQSFNSMCRTSAVTKNFTRSHFHLCGRHPSQLSVVNARKGVKCTCGQCRGVKTDVDKELSKFLDGEIQYERESEKTLGKPQAKASDFTITTTGPDIKFVRQMQDETITISLCVNNSVDSDESSMPAEEAGEKKSDEEGTSMVSKPSFLIELKKGAPLTLGIQCAFPLADDYGVGEGAQEGEEEETIVDSFEIEEIALYEKNWDEHTYNVQAAVMDGNLYELMMDMLDERGLNDEFVQELIVVSTRHEHTQYVGFLQKLKDFIGSK